MKCGDCFNWYNDTGGRFGVCHLSGIEERDDHECDRTPAIRPMEELEALFWAETSEEWTQEWREDLTPGEVELVQSWDERVDKGMLKMYQRILELEEGHAR